MYSFSYLKPVCCSMSSSNCCFLSCIHISQEAGQVVWYSHLFQNFPQFIVMHTVKGFGIVNKAEIDVFFWNSLAFSMIQRMLAIWSLVPWPFLKPAWTTGSSWFTYCWSLAWRILSIILLVCEVSAIVQYFKHSLALPFFGIGIKTDLFQSCGHCWVFQICCGKKRSEKHRRKGKNFPDKNTEVGCHFLLQGIFLTQVSYPYLLAFASGLFYHWVTWEAHLTS